MPFVASFPIKKRLTVDFELLMYHLLAYPGLKVVPRIDAGDDMFGDQPLLTYVGSNGHMISNGEPSVGWEWTLDLSLYVGGSLDEDGTLKSGMKVAGEMADTIYQNVHLMEDPFDGPGPVADVGYVSGVDDVAMFDRVGGFVFPDKQVVQYNATFTVRVRPN